MTGDIRGNGDGPTAICGLRLKIMPPNRIVADAQALFT
jgi:hypothetical protein